jgi:hypothetical protein
VNSHVAEIAKHLRHSGAQGVRILDDPRDGAVDRHVRAKACPGRLEAAHGRLTISHLIEYERPSTDGDPMPIDCANDAAARGLDYIARRRQLGSRGLGGVDQRSSEQMPGRPLDRARKSADKKTAEATAATKALRAAETNQARAESLLKDADRVRGARAPCRAA